jgi:membrane dipeptidase
MTTARIPVFDGHNDVLLRLYRDAPDDPGAFLTAGAEGALDLPRARAGGFAGGFFAVFVPELPGPDPPDDDLEIFDGGYAVRYAEPIDLAFAQRFALALTARLFRLAAASAGQVEVVRSADSLARCLDTGVLAAVLHFEGAEPVDPDLDALHVFYQAGLRSLGLVWSRPNAFGFGVPFRYPHSPDTGPGLTDAGRALVRACNDLGVLIDLAHLNEQGFWDVAALSQAPLVASHSAAHAICPSTRNLTDRQLDAIRDSDGLVGLNFCVSDLRPDGALDADTPLSLLVEHADYLVDRIGLDRVAFGSDFDGATMPRDLADATGLPALLAALAARGYDEPALRKLAHENWQRVLRQTWRE